MDEFQRVEDEDNSSFENPVYFMPARSMSYVALLMLAYAVAALVLAYVGFYELSLIILVGHVACGLAFAAFSYRQSKKVVTNPERYAEIIVDEEGIGGTRLFDHHKSRISWKRIGNIELDGAAVVIRFDPKSMSSASPVDRRSVVRLMAYNTPPEELRDVIVQRWRSFRI